MSRRVRSFAVLAAAGLFVVGPGCNEGKPSVDTSTTEATVKGTITFKGKPVTKGEVAFDPSNYQRKNEAARRVPIGADGGYSVKTLVGSNKVSFSIPEMTHDPKLQDLSLSYEVPSGESTCNIELPPPAPAP